MESPLLMVASFAVVLVAHGAWAARRRSALNEALHELRRPLQALTFAVRSPEGGRSPAAESSLQMTTVALARLDREINGGPAPRACAPVAVEPLLLAATQRWGARVALRGGSLDRRGGAHGARVDGDPFELAQVLDNLIDNAVEHGGPAIVLGATRGRGTVRVSVLDSGRRSGPRPAAAGPSRLRSRLAGRSRHGHGLEVVRRIVAEHGGSFSLRPSPTGCSATIELPLAKGSKGDTDRHLPRRSGRAAAA